MEQTPKGSSKGKIFSNFHETSKQVCERDYRIARGCASSPRSFPVMCNTLISMMKR